MQNMSVLIVDDNRNAAEIVASIIRSIGEAHIRCAPSEQEAFRAFCDDRFDLVIVDQDLGVAGDGANLVIQIREDPDSPNRVVPILMIAAHTEMTLVRQARDFGVSEFLKKPFSPADLIRRLEILINRPRDFASSTTYFGPDRRRRAGSDYEGPERRKRGN